MTDSDETLLKAFAIHRDESAFRELADRYLGLVFHTALRRTRNRQIAEEVSQNILCALANKAPSLAKTPDLLAAWLHRATLFESSKAMRAESSRQRRQPLVHADDAPPEIPVWTDALPHLDAALDQLPDSDRRVLLLHFFENRPFPGIARSLGKSTAAIQKQSQRALEKLARLLRAKGVTLTATAVATGLTAELAKAAPVSLLQSATAAALTGYSACSTTGLTLMFASKSKALVPVVILLCLTPLALQQVAISRAQDRFDFLSAGIAATDHPATGPSNRTRSPGRGISSNFDVTVLVDECDQVQTSNALTSRIRFKQKLAELDPDALDRLIRECLGLPIHRQRKVGLLRELVATLSRTDPARAVKSLTDAGTAEMHYDIRFSGVISQAFAVWAKDDPLSALAWFKARRGMQDDARRFGVPDFHSDSGQTHHMGMNFSGPMLNALVFSKSTELRTFLLDASAGERRLLFEAALDDPSIYLYTVGTFAEAEAGLIAAYLPVLREYIPEPQHRHMLEILTSADK